jgi:ABC-type polysaccharide/polyol phosphate export permease
MLKMKSAGQDLLEGWRRSSLWLTLGWDDVKLQYKRSVLGPLWITLGTAFFIGIMGHLWTALLQRDSYVFIPWFTVGLTLWRLITSIIVGGASTFTRASSIIQNIPMPLSVHVYRMITQHVTTYAHNFLIVVVVLILFHVPITIETLLFFPGFLIVIVTGAALSISLGLIGARFRDFSPTISMFMTPMFFLTPVLWMPDMLSGGRYQIALLNPFTHFLAVVREPLLGRAPSSLNYGVSLGILGILVVVATHLLGRYRLKVPYWI